MHSGGIGQIHESVKAIKKLRIKMNTSWQPGLMVEMTKFTGRRPEFSFSY